MTTDMTTQVMQQALDACEAFIKYDSDESDDGLQMMIDYDEAQRLINAVVPALREAIAAHEIAAQPMAYDISPVDCAEAMNSLILAFDDGKLSDDEWALIRVQIQSALAAGARAGRARLAKEIAALKAAQPVEPAVPEQKTYRRPVTNRCPKCVGLACLCDGSCIKPATIAQPAPAAPYQVPDGWQLVPPEPDESMFRAVTHLDYTSQTDVGWIEGYRCMLAAAPKAAAAPYQVTTEDVQTVLDVYWAPGNSTVNGETMRRALEAYEARKAAA